MQDSQANRQADDGDGLLSRCDQRIVALGTLIGWTTVVVWWWVHGGGRGDLVEIDRTAPYEVAFTLDINEAQWSELAQLPSLGETLARRIVNERDRDGPYASVNELERRVEGIGPRTFEEIREHLRPTAAVGETHDDWPAEASRD